MIRGLREQATNCTVKMFQFSEWYTYGTYYLLQYDKLTAMERNDGRNR